MAPLAFFVGYSTNNEIVVFCFYDTTNKHIRLSCNLTWLDKIYGTWKVLRTNIIKLEEYDVDDPGEFGRDDKDNENFEIQPGFQPIIVEEKTSVCTALHKLQTFYNYAPEATTMPQILQSRRELPQEDSVRE